jgi:hypothetical protein
MCWGSRHSQSGDKHALSVYSSLTPVFDMGFSFEGL